MKILLTPLVHSIAMEVERAMKQQGFELVSFFGCVVVRKPAQRDGLQGFVLGVDGFMTVADNCEREAVMPLVLDYVNKHATEPPDSVTHFDLVGRDS